MYMHSPPKHYSLGCPPVSRPAATHNHIARFFNSNSAKNNAQGSVRGKLFNLDDLRRPYGRKRRLLNELPLQNGREPNGAVVAYNTAKV